MSGAAGGVAVISGGVGDIGRAIASELAARGMDIAIGDLVSDEDGGRILASIFARVRAAGRRASYQRVDVTDAAAVGAWIAAVERDLGVPRAVVVNAAVVTPRDLLELGAGDWRRDLAVVLDGAFHLAQAGARRMVAARIPGRIVFVGSWAADVPDPAIGAYCAAKAGARMLMKLFASRLAAHGILVNEVAPGYVDAGLSGRMFQADPALRAACVARVPVGALIGAGEVAREVARLCDPELAHITGSVVLMDGGLSLRLPATST